MTFNKPFNAGNPLTVAKKIVDGDYEPIPVDFYSELLRETIKSCMISD